MNNFPKCDILLILQKYKQSIIEKLRCPKYVFRIRRKFRDICSPVDWGGGFYPRPKILEKIHLSCRKQT